MNYAVTLFVQLVTVDSIIHCHEPLFGSDFPPGVQLAGSHPDGVFALPFEVGDEEGASDADVCATASFVTACDVDVVDSGGGI